MDRGRGIPLMNVLGEEQKIVKCCTGLNSKSDFEDFVTPSMPCIAKPMKKSPKLVNIYSIIPKFSLWAQLIANSNL